MTPSFYRGLRFAAPLALLFWVGVALWVMM